MHRDKRELIDHPVTRAVTKFVCKATGLSEDMLRRNRTRVQQVVIANHIIWYTMLESGIATCGELEAVFDRNRTSISYGVRHIRAIVRSPTACFNKDSQYPLPRKKWIAKVATDARALALSVLAEHSDVKCCRDSITIPVYRLRLNEMDNLAMADLSTRLSGGWLVEVEEFNRRADSYPTPVKVAVEGEKEAKFVWVIPMSSSESIGSTDDASSKGNSIASPPTTSSGMTPQLTSPETQTKPESTKTSKLQTQHA